MHNWHGCASARPALSSVSAAPPSRLQALNCAAATGDEAAIKRMLAAGLWVNEADGRGLTALHCAAGRNALPALRALCAAGASTAQRTQCGNLALHHAALGG